MHRTHGVIVAQTARALFGPAADYVVVSVAPLSSPDWSSCWGVATPMTAPLTIAESVDEAPSTTVVGLLAHRVERHAAEISVRSPLGAAEAGVSDESGLIRPRPGAVLGVPDADPGSDPLTRRIERLRQELVDEGVALPADPRIAEMLLAELDYARHPSFHEGVCLRFGAIGVERRLGVGSNPAFTSVIDCVGRDVAVVWRLADGRSSFVTCGIEVPSISPASTGRSSTRRPPSSSPTGPAP